MGECAEELVAEIVPWILEHVPPAVRHAMTTLRDIEAGWQQFVRVLGQQLTPASLATDPAQPVGTCQVCGNRIRVVDHQRPRSLLGIFGDYRLVRS